MEEIIIPNLEDDDEDDLQMPSFGRGAFGNSSSSSLPDMEAPGHGFGHQAQSSSDSFAFGRHGFGASGGSSGGGSAGGPVVTPSRPSISKTHTQPVGSMSYSQTGGYEDRPRLGMQANGSTSSITTSGPTAGPAPGFLSGRKGSFANLKNAFKTGSKDPSFGLPPIPHGAHGSASGSGAGYPALKNPFSSARYDTGPSSPSTSRLGQSPRGRAMINNGSISSTQQGYTYERKPSIAATHMSQRSQGGRSVASHGSSNFRADDHPMPALPPIPMRNTPSRLARGGSGSGSAFHFDTRRNASIGGDEVILGNTPGEEALRMVFKDFRQSADGKIARICGRPLNTQPSLNAYLESGIDTQLDAIITSLAHCSRRHPRRVSDVLHNWTRQHCEGITSSEVRMYMDRSLGVNVRVEEAASILSQRKSQAARYLLNRALIELVRLTPKEVLGEELGMTLESNAFNAYKTERGDDGQGRKPGLQVELLGELSKTRFLTISDRFIRELSKSAAQPASRETDTRMEHLLKGMRCLKLRVYPENELEESAEFIQALAALFSNAATQTLKLAYADTFVSLLHPVVETATAEVNHPVWSPAISIILQRAHAIASKPKYWPAIFPLIVLALCVSPRDVFMQQWQPTMDTIMVRLKDRTTRVLCMNAFIRLFWVYLHRCPESSTSTRRRIDGLFRNFFEDNGPLYPADMNEPFVIILHYAFARQLDIAEEMIVDFTRPIEGNVDPALTNRAAYLIRAITATLRSMEEDRTAPWPTSADLYTLPETALPSSGDAVTPELAANPDVVTLLPKSGPAIFKLLIHCDRLIGGTLLSSESVTISGNPSSSAIDNPEALTRKHGDVHASYTTRLGPTMRLIATLLDSLPRLLNPDAPFSQVANLLSRATFSADARVCDSAAAAIRRIAVDATRCLTMVVTYRDFVIDTRHVFRDTFVGSRLMESQFERVIQLWLDLCLQLVQHQRIAVASPADEDEAPSLGAAGLAKIEAAAVFLLASSSVTQRRLAGKILSVARDLEGTQRRPSAAFRYSRIIPADASLMLTRVAQLYDVLVEEANLDKIAGLSDTDRARAESVKGRTLGSIAESDQPKDAALWTVLLPHFVQKMGEHLPIACGELRSVICATVLRLQGHVHSMGNPIASRGRASPRPQNDVTALAEHWKSYLAILCVTMPTAGPPPQTPSVPRVKDAVILTPDTIHSPVIFHYLISLFSWEDVRFRDVAIHALGATRHPLLRPLAEVLLGAVRRLADGRRSTNSNAHWTAIAQVFELISPSILEPSSLSANLQSMISFVKITSTMLVNSQDDTDLQALRRSFCVVVENLTNSIAKLDSSDRFFGQDLRGAIFKLCYDWCHVGRRPDVARARESQVVQAAAEGYRGERHRAQYLEEVQQRTRALSASAAEAMAGLCQGNLVSSVDPSPETEESMQTVDPLIVLRWVRGMLTSVLPSHHVTARKALSSLLQYNWDCQKLLEEVLHQSFGEGEQFGLDASFFGVLADILSEGTVQLPIQQLCCLTLSKLGHPVVDVRLRAFQLATSLLRDSPQQVDLAALLPATSSSIPSIFREAQQDIASKVANAYTETALSFVSECSERLSQFEAPRRPATLAILPGWLELIDLADLDEEQAHLESQTLSSLVYLAVRFFHDHTEEIVRILEAFAGDRMSGNMNALIKHLFEQSGKRRSPEFVAQAQRIVACLARCEGADMVFDDICNFVEPASMAALTETEPEPSASDSLANLDAVMAGGSSHSFSTGQLAFIFATDMLPYRLRDVDMAKQLPTLLHVALSQCDSPSAFVREQAQTGLFQILRAWISDLSNVSSSKDVAAIWTAAEGKLSALARNKADAFWRADDQGDHSTAFFAPTKMTGMIVKTLGIILPLQPKMRQTWGEIALTWATSCPIRHIACRSFQIFRVLSPKVNTKMVSDILARMSSTIASSSSEIQTFNREVLRTLTCIVQSLQMGDMAAYPQMFWCATACLSTPYEDEYSEVIELLSHVLDKTNLSDSSVVEHLQSYQPPDWVGPRPHLQALLLVGLRSNKTDMLSFDLIRRLASVTAPDLIDEPQDRLINGFIAALPWMLHSTDLGEPNEELATMALDLAALAEDHPSLPRLLTSFAKVKFRSKDDFIRQACSLLRDFLPTHALQIIKLLVAFVLNDNDWMREKSMQVLQLVLQNPEVRAPLVNHGIELLQPLLRLVSTKHAGQALELLDMPIAAAAQAEALTTSMMATGDIFGSISESGWSVPRASEAAGFASDNVTAVFNTCAVETRAASAHFSMMQFADIAGPEAINVFNRSFADFASPELPAMLMMTRGESHSGSGSGMAGREPQHGEMSPDHASMGDLVSALHSLGQFFDDAASSNGDAASPVARKRYGHGTMPSDSVSERRVKAILARGRNASGTSPLYETSALPNSQSPMRRHRHLPSEAFTESSMASSTDGGDTTQKYGTPLPRSGANNAHDSGNNSDRGPYGAYRGRHKQTNPSMSSMSAVSDSGDRTDHLFALEEQDDDQ